MVDLFIMNSKIHIAITQAREERDFLLSRSYIPRDGIDSFRARLAGNQVMVVTGPRRAGKSVFALTALADEDFAYVNLEDEQLEGVAGEDILQGLNAVYGPFKTVLFDEIQYLSGWEKFITRLHRRGFGIVITGSNAHLLDTTLASALTGRYTTHRVLPFSFPEYCRAENLTLQESEPGTAVHAVQQYLDRGGYPEPAVGSIDPRSYASTLFDAVLYKDVVARHRVRFPAQLSDVALFFASMPGGEYTFNALSRLSTGASVVTMQKYAGFLEEAYLFLSLGSFSWSAAKRLKAARKAYPVDTAFLSARGGRFSHDWGRLLETGVFLDLFRRGYEPGQTLYFYKTRQNREVDFVLKSGLGVERLVQVCWNSADPQTLDRECRALAEASAELRCPACEIVTLDNNETLDVRGVRIACIPAWKWLSVR